jgi:hypothetical protein
MSESNIQKIKQRIMALLAKAKGTDNEHEAAAFLAKAMDLMQQYQLDVADMVDADDPILKHVGLEAAESGHAWRWKLYSAVAQLYGCKSIHVGKMVKGKKGLVPGYEQVLVGRESAIITTDLMYPWIVGQVKDAAKRLAATSGMSEQGQAKRVAAALISRIHRLIREQQETVPTTDAGRNALVVLDQVTAKYEEMFPDAVTMRRRASITDAGARAAAEGIGLHRQTSGRSVLQIGGR